MYLGGLPDSVSFHMVVRKQQIELNQSSLMWVNLRTASDAEVKLCDKFNVRRILG